MAEPQKRTRRVFGRIEWRPKNGKPVVFEQTEFGLMVHVKKSKKEPAILTFRRLWDLVNNDGQQPMI